MQLVKVSPAAQHLHAATPCLPAGSESPCHAPKQGTDVPLILYISSDGYDLKPLPEAQADAKSRKLCWGQTQLPTISAKPLTEF